MSIHLHASDETLMRHAFGTLSAGPAVVIAAHLAVCPACRARATSFEAVGGVMLESGPAETMTPRALARTLERMDERPIDISPARRPSLSMPDGAVLPAALDGCKVGPWLWVAPGIRLSRVRLPDAPDANVVLFRVASGKALPYHGHTGAEYIQVICGSFDDGRHLYAPGDLSEADVGVDHSPVTAGAGDCVSLAAVEGKARMHTLLGRLVQPFTGL